MLEEKKIKIALVRGDSLNEWEGKLYEDLGHDFSITGFCNNKNLYDIKNLTYPVKRLKSCADNFLMKNYYKYFKGIYKVMHGLERELQQFDIASTAEIFNFYTNQAVRAKNNNKKLKVVTYFADNTFGRFEYNYWPGFSSPPSYWRKKMQDIFKENIEGVDLFTPITKYSAELLLEYGVNESKIKIVMPAILMPDDKIENDFQLFLNTFRLSDKEVYMVVNRMVKEKGVYEIFYGWKLFMKGVKTNNKLLVFIGDGPELKNLMRMVDESNLSKHVIFIKQLPNQYVRKLYQYAKALILDSLPNSVWQEQFGYVLAQAISAGCPVVTTYSGAIPEVVKDAGLLFSPGNPIELKDCLVKLDNSATYQVLKDNCSRVKNKFVVENFRNSMVKIFEDLSC